MPALHFGNCRIEIHAVTPSSLAHATRLYKALAHPARLRMLAMLRGGELGACHGLAHGARGGALRRPLHRPAPRG